MKHRLFTILSALSLLLFVAVVVLWVRSYWAEYWLAERSTTQTLERMYHGSDSFGCSRGLLVFHRHEGPAMTNSQWVLLSYRAIKHRADWFDSQYRSGLLGFEVNRQSSYEHWHSEMIVVVPLWSIAALALALPASSAWRAWAARASSMLGHCDHCGYDLRATPGRCPECGAAANAS